MYGVQKMIQRIDELAAKIETMDKLSLVNFYYLYDKENSIPAVMAYYHFSEVINLSSLDSHFNRLMEKLCLLYKEEALEREIIADELTREILEKGYERSQENIDKVTEGFEEIPEKIYYRKGYAYYTERKAIEYILKNLYDLYEKELYVSEMTKDWCGNGEMTVSVNGERKRLRYRLFSEDTSYTQIVINDFIETDNLLTLSIIYTENGMQIIFNDELLSLSGEYLYRIKGESLWERILIKEGEKILFGTENIYGSKKPEGQDSSDNLNTFISRLFTNPSVYELPWGQLIYTEEGNFGQLTGFVTDCDEFKHAYVLSLKKIIISGKKAFDMEDCQVSYYEPGLRMHYAVISFENSDRVFVKKDVQP